MILSDNYNCSSSKVFVYHHQPVAFYLSISFVDKINTVREQKVINHSEINTDGILGKKEEEKCIFRRRTA